MRMQFEPNGRMLKLKEVCNYTGLSAWQAHTFLARYGVLIGTQFCISAQRLKSLIDDGTVQRAAQRRVGRPRKAGQI